MKRLENKIDDMNEVEVKAPQKLLFMTILALVATIYAVIIVLKFIKEIA